MFTPDVYERIREGCQRSAAAVVPVIYDIVKPETVVDVGGGEGWWANVFAYDHDCSCLVLDESGPESDPGTIETFWPGEVGHRHAKLDSFENIMVPTPGSGRDGFDLALCLEVAEHLPEEFAAPLVSRLCQLAPVVLWSAAIPNQGGHGHVNEQWPDYWAKLFEAHDFDCTDWPRWEFWDDERVEPWYRQNMLLFARRDRVDALGGLVHFQEWRIGRPERVVHPDIYGWRVAERDRLNEILYPPNPHTDG